MHAEDVGFNPEENFLEDDDQIPRQKLRLLIIRVTRKSLRR